jgi:hypothetical protein
LEQKKTIWEQTKPIWEQKKLFGRCRIPSQNVALKNLNGRRAQKLGSSLLLTMVKLKRRTNVHIKKIEK